MADEFEIGGTDRPKTIFDLADLISSGSMDYGLEERLWGEFAPEFGAQINDYINSLPGADPNAYDSDGAVAPTTDSTGSDRKLTSEELRDIFSDNLTAGDIYGDPLAEYEGVRDPVTGAVSAAMWNDYLNSILETGQYQGLLTLILQNFKRHAPS
jgi:hypothetical protein